MARTDTHTLTDTEDYMALAVTATMDTLHTDMDTDTTAKERQDLIQRSPLIEDDQVRIICDEAYNCEFE